MDILDLIERIDTLITKGAELSNTKAQLATLHERVAALLAEHDNLKAAHSSLQQEHAKLKDSQPRDDSQAWDDLRRRTNIDEKYSGE